MIPQNTVGISKEATSGHPTKTTIILSILFQTKCVRRGTLNLHAQASWQFPMPSETIKHHEHLRPL